MKAHTFTAIIQDAGGGGAFVEILFDVETLLARSAPGSTPALAESPIAAGGSGRLHSPALAPGASVRQVQVWGQNVINCWSSNPYANRPAKHSEMKYT